MLHSENWRDAARFLGGGMAGIAAVAGLSFGTGLVVSADHMAAAVRSASVETFATVCAERGIAEWIGSGHEILALSQADESVRLALATRFIPAAEPADNLEAEIEANCSRIMAATAADSLNDTATSGT